MTFAQLQAFSTVARLGSVKAAARALGVSEPAVSGAIAALRRDLGDELFTRVSGGISLTPGGTRLASTAAEILGLADRARRSVGEAQGDAALLGERWVVGPSGAERDTAVGEFLARNRMAPDDVSAFPTYAGAVAPASRGAGVMLAIAHTVLDELRRGSLTRIDVRGTPIERLWYASTLGPDRRTPAAWALRRFVTTPEATQAMLARSRGVPAGRFRSPVYVTLWSSHMKEEVTT